MKCSNSSSLGCCAIGNSLRGEGVESTGIRGCRVPFVVVRPTDHSLPAHTLHPERFAYPFVCALCVCQALASFSPDKLAALLSLLIAVIDQNRPEVGEQEGSTQALSTPHPSVRAPRKQSDKKGLGPKKKAAGVVSEATPSAADVGSAVRRVSCTGNVGSSAVDHSGSDGGGSADTAGRRVAAVASAGARQELLQRACLRLFVTGMDLFFPSCAQRYSLLARYLSKYLR